MRRQAHEVTDATFDSPHPNPGHIIGVTYCPIERCVIVPIDECGTTDVARVGDWIVRADDEPFRVYSDENFRAAGWHPNAPEKE